MKSHHARGDAGRTDCTGGAGKYLLTGGKNTYPLLNANFAPAFSAQISPLKYPSMLLLLPFNLSFSIDKTFQLCTDCTTSINSIHRNIAHATSLARK
jgi:hypothetical protein